MLLALAGTAAAAPALTWRADLPLVRGQDQVVGLVGGDGGEWAVIVGQGAADRDRPHFVGLLDTRTGEIPWKVQLGTYLRAQRAAASADGRVIAAPDLGFSTARLVVFHDRLPVPAWTLPLPTGLDPVEVDVTPEGAHVAIGAQHGPGGRVDISVLDRTGALAWSARIEPLLFPNTFGGTLLRIELSADGGRALVVLDRAVYVLERDALAPLAALPRAACCGGALADLSADGTLLAVGGLTHRGTVMVLRLDDRISRFVPLHRIETERVDVRALAFSADGSTLAIGANGRGPTPFGAMTDGLVLVVDGATGAITGRHADYGLEGRIEAVDVSANGSRILVAALGTPGAPDRDVLTLLDRDGSAVLTLDGGDALGSATAASLDAAGGTLVALGSTGHPSTGVSDRVLLGAR